MNENLNIEKENEERPLKKIEVERPEKLMREVLNDEIEKMWMSATWRRRALDAVGDGRREAAVQRPRR